MSESYFFHNTLAFLTKLILGISVFSCNFIVFCVWITKPDKRATDTLILTNLFIDSIYGLQMICLTDKYLYGRDHGIGAWDMTFLVFFMQDSLMFFSLCMLVVMSINRYLAVVRPIR